MNKENKKRFEQLYLKYTLEKYPSFVGREAHLPPPKLKESGANDLTRLVIDFLDMSGHFAERISTTGRMVNKSKQVTDCIGRTRTIGGMTYIPTTGVKGSADISSTIKVVAMGQEIGLSVKWEVKWGKDIQSNYQKDYQEKTNKAGGKYFIIRTFDEFIEIYDSLLNSFL
jgi:hypothetical protein